MSDRILDDHRRALEDAFFARQNAELLAKLRGGGDPNAALAAATGVSDPAALARLTELGVTPEAAAALTLLPMAAIAWADGGVSLGERGAVMRAAERAGVTPGSPAFELLDGWLREPPSAGLLEAWKAYARDLAARATAEERARFAETVLGRARAVADAEGGFFGMGRRISAAEQALLDELHKALVPG